MIEYIQIGAGLAIGYYLVAISLQTIGLIAEILVAIAREKRWL